MGQVRKLAHLNFAGSGSQTITVEASQHAAIFQADFSIANDTTYEIRIGATKISSGNLIANASPVQLFFYGFGKGRGTGVNGDDIVVTLGDAGDCYLTYILAD